MRAETLADSADSEGWLGPVREDVDRRQQTSVSAGLLADCLRTADQVHRAPSWKSLSDSMPTLAVMSATAR